jgi:tRNA pseudouridine38-40 synthase
VIADRHADEPASPTGAGGLIRVRIDLAYDGTDFSGWARQPGRRTVQDTVEQALATVLRLDSRASLTVAGRTDAGVHARGQVAHVDLPQNAWLAAGDAAELLARIVPPDIRIASVIPAAPGFDARFSALSRRYSYRISDDRRGPDPMERRITLRHRRPLDAGAMNAASTALVGLHDFAAFCRFRPGGSTIRTLLAMRWVRIRTGLVVATVEADAFCHSMVRALVGALIPVGEGRRDVEWPARILSARARDSAVNVAPAHGLTLEHVTYPPDDELACQATATRRPRRPD